MSSKLQQQKNVISFKPYTEENKKKKIGICSILGRIQIRIQNRTGSGSIIPEADPHHYDTDPKHCIRYKWISLFVPYVCLS